MAHLIGAWSSHARLSNDELALLCNRHTRTPSPQKKAEGIYMGVSQNKGPQNRPQYIMIPIIRTPKEGPLTFGNPPYPSPRVLTLLRIYTISGLSLRRPAKIAMDLGTVGVVFGASTMSVATSATAAATAAATTGVAATTATTATLTTAVAASAAAVFCHFGCRGRRQ